MALPVFMARVYGNRDVCFGLRVEEKRQGGNMRRERRKKGKWSRGQVRRAEAERSEQRWGNATSKVRKAKERCYSASPLKRGSSSSVDQEHLDEVGHAADRPVLLFVQPRNLYAIDFSTSTMSCNWLFERANVSANSRLELIIIEWSLTDH